MNKIENCVYCGGDTAKTPGVYVNSNSKTGWPCGYCNGTGIVPTNSQWIQTPLAKPRKVFLWQKYLASRFLDGFLIAGLISSVVIMLYVLTSVLGHLVH